VGVAIALAIPRSFNYKARGLRAARIKRARHQKQSPHILCPLVFRVVWSGPAPEVEI
jgi:hypothetical protein